MIDEEVREEWRRQASEAMESALDEYAPEEFLVLLDAYEEALEEIERLRDELWFSYGEDE